MAFSVLTHYLLTQQHKENAKRQNQQPQQGEAEEFERFGFAAVKVEENWSSENEGAHNGGREHEKQNHKEWRHESVGFLVIEKGFDMRHKPRHKSNIEKG